MYKNSENFKKERDIINYLIMTLKEDNSTLLAFYRVFEVELQNDVHIIYDMEELDDIYTRVSDFMQDVDTSNFSIGDSYFYYDIYGSVVSTDDIIEQRVDDLYNIDYSTWEVIAETYVTQREYYESELCRFINGQQFLTLLEKLYELL